MTTDAVWTWHTDPYTCGVAKFNQQLAQRLGVPCEPMGLSDARRPLISVKPEELGDLPLHAFMPYDLFLHGRPRPKDLPSLRHATKIFCANRELAAEVRETRPDSVAVFCPSLLEPDPLVRLFTFGMAHKQIRRHFERVRLLLGDRAFSVHFSTGVHEGQPLGETIQRARDEMAHVFGGRAQWAGLLSDRDVRTAMRASDVTLLFYDPALRENNTTLWAALESRATVITNLDRWSPTVPCYDIETLNTWPSPDTPTWDALIARLRA